MLTIPIVIGDFREITPDTFSQKFGVVVADPPWSYGYTIRNGIAEENYNVLTPEELGSIDVSALCLPDAVLFLWGTWPQLPVALNVMTDWGFEYVTGFPWVKLDNGEWRPKMGVGHWVRGVSEYVLIGKRGNPKTPQVKYLGLLSPHLPHSMKPDDIHQLAQTLPGPYLELFGRRSVTGWTVFGNEVECDLFVTGV